MEQMSSKETKKPTSEEIEAMRAYFKEQIRLGEAEPKDAEKPVEELELELRERKASAGTPESSEKAEQTAEEAELARHEASRSREVTPEKPEALVKVENIVVEPELIEAEITEEGGLPEKRSRKSEEELWREELDRKREECVRAQILKEKIEHEETKLTSVREKIKSWTIRYFAGDREQAYRKKRGEREEVVKEELRKSRENFEEKRAVFSGALKEYREYLLKGKEGELNKLLADGKIASGDFDKQLEKYAKELVVETSALEAKKLFDLKEDIKIKEAGEKEQRVKEIIYKVADHYRKMPLKYKIAISGGLIGGGLVAGTVGGATGGVLLSGLFVGKFAQRAFGGAALAVGLEAERKRAQERKAERIVEKEFADDYVKACLEKSDKLDEKIFELLGRKQSEKTKRYILAGVAGSFVGSGALAESLRQAADWLPDNWKEAVFQKIHSLGSFVSEKLESAKEILPERISGRGSVGDTATPEMLKAAEFTQEDWARGVAQEKALGPGEYPKPAIETFQIGSRGPEGNIIEYLKNNPKVAKNWGWDPNGKISLEKFAGIKAHEKWLDFAKAEVGKPEIQAKLGELGYAKDISGYSEMMRRIGSGVVEIDPRGNVRLVDMNYLKATGVTEPKIGGDIPDKEFDKGRPQISQWPEEVAAVEEKLVERKPMSPAEAYAIEKGKSYVVNLPPEPEVQVKNFVSGEEYERLIKEKIGIDKLLDKDGLFDKNVLSSISEQVDKTIADTMNMDLATYDKIKTINLEKFVFAESSTWGEHAEWQPAKRVIDAYLAENKFLDQEDLKGTVGDFFKKIIKVDVGPEVSKLSPGQTVFSGAAVEQTFVKPSVQEVIKPSSAEGIISPSHEEPASKAAAETPVAESVEPVAESGADEMRSLEEEITKRENELRESLTEKQPDASDMKTYEEQLTKEEQEFYKQLPTEREVKIWADLDKLVAAKEGGKAAALTEAIKKGDLTSDDFEKYYVRKLGIAPSDELRANFKDNFKALQENNTQKRLMAERDMQVIFRRLEKQ